jgi:hypothetical protein
MPRSRFFLSNNTLGERSCASAYSHTCVRKMSAGADTDCRGLKAGLTPAHRGRPPQSQKPCERTPGYPSSWNGTKERQ